MQKAYAKIVSKWVRSGDKNPNVEVWGIKTESGHVFESCGNYDKHLAYPDPIQNVKDAEIGKKYVIVFGKSVSYPIPTLIGIEVKKKKISKEVF